MSAKSFIFKMQILKQSKRFVQLVLSCFAKTLERVDNFLKAQLLKKYFNLD